MVFLFIVFIVIILLFMTPISVGFNIFSQENKLKPKFSINIFNFIRYLDFRKRKNKKIKNKKLKKYSIGFTVNKKADLHILKNFLPNKFMLEIKIPKGANVAIIYPIIGLLTAINQYFEYNANEARITLEYGGSNIYFQGKVTIKFNLFMIFSVIFQIIKIEIKRRQNGSD